MIEITKEITIDLTRKSNSRVIFARQLDNGCRKILIGLTDNGKEYIVPTYALATVNVLRPDGESNAFSAKVTNDGRVEVTLGAWTLGVAGETKCNISLYFDENKKLSTPDIILDVGEELYSGDDISSDRNYSLLTSLLSECSEVLEAEADRLTNETKRVVDEKLRVASEEKRISNENVRNQKESERIQREKLRSEAESGRAAAESQRVSNELSRIEAENARREVMGNLESALDRIIDIEDDMSSGDVILATAYPIGSIYMSINATSPSALFGGTWEQIEDKFLLGAGSTYSNGATGGEASVSLTVSEMPQHDHAERISATTINAVALVAPNTSGTRSGRTISSESYTSYHSSSAVVRTETNGSGVAHNNMPPYLAVYMWKRTA